MANETADRASGDLNVGISSRAESIRGRVLDGEGYFLATNVVANVIAVACQMLDGNRKRMRIPTVD